MLILCNIEVHKVWPQIEEFFLKLKQCLDSIENVLFAATCAGEVLQRLTSSPEQFYAAQLHMSMCEKWKNENDSAGISIPHFSWINWWTPVLNMPYGLFTFQAFCFEIPLLLYNFLGC